MIHLKYLNKAVDLNKARLEKKEHDILRGALDFLENLSYVNFSEKVKSFFTHHTSTLSACKSTLDEIETSLRAILQHLLLRDPTKQNDHRDFLDLHYFAEKVQVLENKIKLLSLKRIEIHCILNTNIQPSVWTEYKVGELSLRTATYRYDAIFPTIHYPDSGPRQNRRKTEPGSDAMG